MRIFQFPVSRNRLAGGDDKALRTLPRGRPTVDIVFITMNSSASVKRGLPILGAPALCKLAGDAMAQDE